MIPLPVCRWREAHRQGQHVCHSASFYAAPNFVTAAFCKSCSCADHEPLPSLPKAMPCVHLGNLLEREAQAGGHGAGHHREEFACVLHGRCTIGPVDQHQPADNRSCMHCADYLARDPFGPNSAEMRRRAEEFLARVPAYPSKRFHGRGIVMAGGGDRFFPSLYVTIRALRHLGCRLPIQVWYLGRKHEMPREQRALLAAYDVECVDADKVRQRHPARRLDGWELKVFATLHCPFEELLFLDADCYPCRNPEFLFERADYRARGAIFWPDLPAVDTRLKWPAFGVADPRRIGSIESGQFVLDKRRSWRPLNLAWFYNDRSDYYYRYCYGDKHTFEVAWARCAQPFVMWEPKGKWVDVAYVQPGPDRLPLFVHRCADKFRFKNHRYATKQSHSLPSYYSSLPMERECWRWLSELASLTGRKLGHEHKTRILSPSRKASRARPRFAIATLYTPEIAALGLRTSKVMAAYAKRHGYEAVIASDRIDASRPAAWSKILLIERYLIENTACDWLMWIDADAVITNPARRLEDLVDESIDFLVAKDLGPSPINTGVFLVRNCPAALEMLRRAYAKFEYIHHSWWEQPALTEAMRECAPEFRARIVSRRLFNSFADEYRPGDFIVHFAGLSPDEKLAGAITRIAAETERRSRSDHRP
jgi:hypothetical protein